MASSVVNQCLCLSTGTGTGGGREGGREVGECLQNGCAGHFTVYIQLSTSTHACIYFTSRRQANYGNLWFSEFFIPTHKMITITVLSLTDYFGEQVIESIIKEWQTK